MTDNESATGEAARKAKREEERALREAERKASRERAEAERAASRARADAERQASREREDRKRAERTYTDSGHRQERRRVPVETLHPELGEYSHVMFDGASTFYISGQVPLAADGEIAGEDTTTQARQVMANLVEALAAAGLDTDSVVKLTVYLTDRADAADFAAVRGEFFDAPYPTSSIVVVSSLLDERWRLEVEAVATQQ